MTHSVQTLFTPLTVGSLTVPNRFAMSPMARQAAPGGIPGHNVATYYQRRAAGGAGLIITEGIRVPHTVSGPSTGVPGIGSGAELAGWRAVIEAVRAEGGHIAAQLWHMGSQRPAEPDDSPDTIPVSPSGIDNDGENVGRAMTVADLEAVVDAFAIAARNAKAVGFDAVEIHGAHGYLLDQFLWEKTNLRTDGYGGSVEGRTRFPVEVVAAVRDAVGPGFPISFRFSQWKTDFYDARIAATPVDLEALLSPLVAAGVDIFHASTRRHYQAAFPAEHPELTLAGWTKKLTGLPVTMVGSVGLNTAHRPGQVVRGHIDGAPVDKAVELFAAGQFDLLAVGRALLADPTWVNRVRNGTLDGFEGFNPEMARPGVV